jgi:hypothetical protein
LSKVPKAKKKRIIPDYDEATVTPIEFAFYYYVGKAKMGLSFHEVGRMTLTTFNKLYKQYREVFDVELRLQRSQMTYQELFKKSQESEEWL